MATTNSTFNGTQSNSTAAQDHKAYKICSILGGLDVTRQVSSDTRGFFASAIDDVEFIREFISEAAYNQGIVGGLSNLNALAASLDWKDRGYPQGTTTLEANLGYTDDQRYRRMERFVSLENAPLVGTKQTDMSIVNAASLIFPWIVDRKSKTDYWWKSHRNGQSQGGDKVPFPFDRLYQAAWIGTYGEAWMYYPPLNVFTQNPYKPYTFGDDLGAYYNSHQEAFVQPNFPENNPTRRAFFTTPYPDTAVAGLSLITATAPVYMYGTFDGVQYNGSYFASCGIDIAVHSVSTLLDVVQNTMTANSFGILVDINFNTIVISQPVVDLIYPPRTGFEADRVTYDKANGQIVQDRRNQTYLVSDTILQGLTELSNADWKKLNQDVQRVIPGDRQYSNFNITLTGDTATTEFYVMYERWQYVAEWVLLVFAPVHEVDYAIDVVITGTSNGAQWTAVTLEGPQGTLLPEEATVWNHGTLDVTFTVKSTPSWIQLVDTSINYASPIVLKAGESMPIPFDIDTTQLDVGTWSNSLSLNVQDYNYPDCFYNTDHSLPISVKVYAKNCAAETGRFGPTRVADASGNCVCPNNSILIGQTCLLYAIFLPVVLVPFLLLSFLALYFYTLHKRKQADSIWEVKSSELHFDDPPLVVGRGTFGYVLLAHYRGTQVAVKRVIPPRSSSDKSGSGSGGRSLLGSKESTKRDNSTEKTAATAVSQGALEQPLEKKINNGNKIRPFKKSVNFKPDVLDSMENGVAAQIKRGSFGTCSVALETSKAGRRANNKRVDMTGGILDVIDEGSPNNSNSSDYRRSSTGSNTSFSDGSNSGDYGFLSIKKLKVFNKRRRMDEYSRLKAEFVEEMRHLSKLRHPCITTVMGAVIAKHEEPMLVMEYMDHGSLYDLVHNETLAIEGELILPILRDIAQGVQFLHTADPEVVHGDLKAQNILVDIRFRAKVADFGLSQKKKLGITGTPYWMAPELLRRESHNTTASDVYSFGIILYEIYSRRDPYEDEDPRQVLKEVCDPQINKRPPVPKSMPPVISSIMHDCLVATADERPTFEELSNRLKRFDVAIVEPGANPFAKKRQSEHTEKNFDLLLKVFPRHIAEALRDGRKVEPEHHDCVTIFFSDIVGFTTIAQELPPEKVADMLDRLYLKFDDLADLHDIFKVETIGDAWMGVTNLVKDQSSDHAKRIAAFALDALQAGKETQIDLEDPERGFVQIRVGFHSGPVLSNVIGSRNPRYAVFGDTVNTASRMESNSLPGKIHASETAAKLVEQQCPGIVMISRGKIDVKGKGEMTTYFVESLGSGDTEPTVTVWCTITI